MKKNKDSSSCLRNKKPMGIQIDSVQKMQWIRILEIHKTSGKLSETEFSKSLGTFIPWLDPWDTLKCRISCGLG